ncbi:MAG: hypothetical protein RI890_997, partial [Actinomycetota bacterium]
EYLDENTRVRLAELALQARQDTN